MKAAEPDLHWACFDNNCCFKLLSDFSNSKIRESLSFTAALKSCLFSRCSCSFDFSNSALRCLYSSLNCIQHIIKSICHTVNQFQFKQDPFSNLLAVSITVMFDYITMQINYLIPAMQWFEWSNCPSHPSIQNAQVSHISRSRWAKYLSWPRYPR